MSAPNIDTRFAGNATYGGVDPWSGDPTKADPGTPRKAEGFTPDKLPAEWLNWLLNAIGAWIYWFAGRFGGLDGSGEWAYETGRPRVLRVPGMAVKNGLTSNAWLCDEAGGAQCQINLAYGNLNLSKWIPTNCILTGITVHTISAHSSTAGMRFKLFEDATQFGATFNSPNTATTGTAVSGALSQTVDRTSHTYYMEVLSSDQAATTPPGDRIKYLDLALTEIGPDPFAPAP